MEPVSPTLAGRFLTTGSPGKPSMILLTWVQICDNRGDNSSRSGLSGCSHRKEEVLVCAVRGLQWRPACQSVPRTYSCDICTNIDSVLSV